MSDERVPADAIDALVAPSSYKLRKALVRQLKWRVISTDGEVFVKVVGLMDTACEETLLSERVVESLGERVRPLSDGRLPELELEGIVPKQVLTPVGYIDGLTVESPFLRVTIPPGAIYVIRHDYLDLVIGLRVQHDHNISRKIDAAVDAGGLVPDLGFDIPNDLVAAGTWIDGRGKGKQPGRR